MQGFYKKIAFCCDFLVYSVWCMMLGVRGERLGNWGEDRR